MGFSQWGCFPFGTNNNARAVTSSTRPHVIAYQSSRATVSRSAVARAVWPRPSCLDILSRLLQRTVRGPTLLTPVRRITLGDDATDFALRPDSSVVERGPEKAGVGGSIPSLATTKFPTQICAIPSFTFLRKGGIPRPSLGCS